MQANAFIIDQAAATQLPRPYSPRLSRRDCKRHPALQLCMALTRPPGPFRLPLQCTACGKWRIVDFRSAQEVEEDSEWTCSMLRRARCARCVCAPSRFGRCRRTGGYFVHWCWQGEGHAQQGDLLFGKGLMTRPEAHRLAAHLPALLMHLHRTCNPT